MSPLLAKRLSDESLGSRLASGEAAAFDELYRRYVHRLAAYGAHLLGDGAAGDDVAQATMLKAYGALRDGHIPGQMKPWLYRIAHNVAIDLVIRRRESPMAELPEEGRTDAGPVGGALVSALASLPERQRRVYVLRELHGLRIDETAAELALSAAQVEQSLFAARNRLAEHLVFGDRLTCVSVRRFAAGPLDGEERRALKSHLRSCAGCRSSLGVRGRALGFLPVTSLEWLRGLVAGGSAPVAAKVGAVVATVSFAAGVPSASEIVRVHRIPTRTTHVAERRQPRVRPSRVVLANATAPVIVGASAFVAAVAKVPHEAAAGVDLESHSHTSGGDEARPQARTDDRGEASGAAPVADSHDGQDTSSGGGSSGRGGSSGDGSDSGSGSGSGPGSDDQPSSGSGVGSDDGRSSGDGGGDLPSSAVSDLTG